MKTTPHALVGCIAIATVLWAAVSMAGIPESALESQLCSAVVGQSSPSENAAQDSHRLAADLLHRARQAMDEKDWKAADALISKAEALDVRYGRLYMGDTPKKARRELERNRNSSGSLIKPSKLFAPFKLNKDNKAPSNDPFVGHPVEANVNRSGGVNQVQPLPTVGSDVRSPSGNTAVPPSDNSYRRTQPGENDVRSPAQGVKKSPLQEARLALAYGDIRRASAFLQQAKAMNVQYRPNDDTPDKVESSIRKHIEVAGLDKETEAYARSYARGLMEQAVALSQWGEFDQAERLADRASKMRVTYGPFEQKPQDVLKQITAMRNQKPNGRTAAAPAASQPGFAMASAPPANNAASRQQVVQLVRQARDAIAAGDLNRAEALARKAGAMRLPDSAFAPGEDRPGLVLLDIGQLRSRQDSRVMPATAAGTADKNANRAYYESNNDRTRNVPASGRQNPTDNRWAQNSGQYRPTPARAPAPPTAGAGIAAQSPGMALFQQGETALRAHDTARAYEFFRQATQYSNDLDPMTRQRLQDHMQLLSANGGGRPQAGRAPTMVDEAAARQQAIVRRVVADLAHRESNARAMRETDPNGALRILEEARNMVEAAGIEAGYRAQLMRRVDRAIAETQQTIEKNRPQIELAEQNKRITQEITQGRRIKLEVQEKLALMIDEFNRLMDQQRYEEAQVVAKRAAELDPTNPVVVQVLLQAKFVNNWNRQRSIIERQEDGFVTALNNAEESAIPFDDNRPYQFPDPREWRDITNSRGRFAGDRGRQRTEREIEIEKKLRTPVSLQFTSAPLSKVLDFLGKMADVNVHLDPQGLAEEGVTTDTPVTIELRNDIMLKSALNLILRPLHLSYVIKDEVLKITSEQMRDGEVYQVVYNVADLVIPIPNFVPGRMGLAQEYNNAMSNVGFGGGIPFGSATATPLAVVASHDGGQGGATIDPSLLAQIGSGGHGGLPTQPSQGMGMGGAGGPGGLGGGAQADFDSLIDLITSTVKPTTWDDVGGPGTIAPFETNLSIVVSQTQDVHQELADLLVQLRRLQDLQVTIEVRFITLNDNFFERIGVDFDFEINDNIDGKGLTFGTPDSAGYVSDPGEFTTGQGVPRDVVDRDSDRTFTVGMSQPGLFNADLDIPFTQGSYNLAVPQFGGFDATAGAQLGFAILSDLEAYFFISAAQGDRRSNVLQAPKVTLFNGQQAMVADQSQSPFVISVVPVVGDFAAAQQPVIVVLSEGTFMTVQAVVSADRRFVRLTVVPFFSTIGEVNTFQFTGTQSTTTDTTREGLQSAATDPAKLWNQTGDTTTTSNSGTTVQLPTYSIVTVATTVSVPDGGTVLLGGIKRLSEGRNEFGTPLLNKLPYVNRLFQNVGIGRETQSLMMMVTPRIIIQEEEEEKLGVLSNE